MSVAKTLNAAAQPHYLAAHLTGLSQGAIEFSATQVTPTDLQIEAVRKGDTQPYATAFLYENRPFTIQTYDALGVASRWVMQRPTPGIDARAEMKTALEALAKGADFETLCDKAIWIKSAGKALYLTPVRRVA